MAVENVTIDIDVDGAAASAAQIAAINQQLNAMSDRSAALDRTTRRLDNNFGKFSNRMKQFGKVVKTVLSPLVKFFATIAKFSFIGLAGQIAVFTTALVGIKAILITGRAAASAYQVALQGVAIAAAGVATAISVAAAAIRQYQEVSLSPFLGGGQAGAAAAARATRSVSPRIAGLLGSEGTNNVVSSLVRGGATSTEVNRIASTIFSLSGGDTAAAVGLAGAIQSGDIQKSLEAVRGAAGFREGALQGVTTQRQLLEALTGSGAVRDEFNSIGEDLANTFLGTLKIEFASLKNFFADIGEPLLEPFRQSFMQISKIIKDDLLSVSAIVQKVGAETFAPTLVRVVDSISEFFRKLIVNNVDSLSDFVDRTLEFFRKFGNFFKAIGSWFDSLKKFEPAANVILEMFKAMGAAAGGAGLFKSFTVLVENNADALERFGASIGGVFGAIFDLLGGGQSGFFNKLPLLSDILDRIARDVIPAIAKIFEKFYPLMERLPDALTGLAKVLDFLAPLIETLVMAINSAFGLVAGAPGGDILGGLGLIAGYALLGRGGKGLKALKGVRSAGAVKGLTNAAGTIGTAAPKVGMSRLSRARTNLSLGRNFAGAGGKLGMIGGKALPVVGGLLGAFQVNSSRQNALETGQMGIGGVLGGASVGAMVGSIIPVVGTTVGAVIGGILGGAIEGISALEGNKRLKDRAKEAMSEYMADITSFSAGSGIGAATQQQQQLDLLIRAIDAAYDESGVLQMEGDTREFRQYLQSIGIDPESVHRDELFAMILNENTVQKIEGNIEKANKFFEDSVNTLVDSLNMTEEAVLDLAERFNIDLYDAMYNLENVARALSATTNQIDLSTGITPTMEGTPLDVQEKLATASASLDELVKAEELTTDLVQNFVSSATAAEVAAGRAPMAAAIAPIKQLERLGKELGRSDISRVASQLLESQFSQITEATGGFVSPEELMAAYTDMEFANAMGGTSRRTTSVGSVEEFLRQASLVQEAFSLGSAQDPLQRLGIIEAQTTSMTSRERDEIARLEAAAAMGGDEATINAAIDRFLITSSAEFTKNMSEAQQNNIELAKAFAANVPSAIISINGTSIPVNENVIRQNLPTSSHITVQPTIGPPQPSPYPTIPFRAD